MAADVVYLAHAAVMDDQIDGLAVILHVEPVAHVQPLAVYRQRLVVQAVGDHQRDQLFREMIGAVVVAATADGHRQAEGAVVRQHQQIGAGLGGAVGAAGVDGRLLGKEQIGPVQRQIAVYLVGGYLMVAGDAVFAAGVHHGLGAQNVGLEEYARILDAAVHMALRRKVDHDIGVLLLKQPEHRFPIADIGLDEPEIGLVHHALQRGEVARVGQFVQADDAVIRMGIQHMENEVAADKPGAAGNDNGHGCLLFNM